MTIIIRINLVTVMHSMLITIIVIIMIIRINMSSMIVMIIVIVMQYHSSSAGQGADAASGRPGKVMALQHGHLVSG